MPTSNESKKVVIATIGSLGDLHPCIAIGQELLRRGYGVTIATTLYYKQKVEAAGIAFRSMRPGWDPTDSKLIRSCEDLRRGLEVLYREMLLPELNNTYRDLLSVADGADLLIAGELVYAAPFSSGEAGAILGIPHFVAVFVFLFDRSFRDSQLARFNLLTQSGSCCL